MRLRELKDDVAKGDLVPIESDDAGSLKEVLDVLVGNLALRKIADSLPVRSVTYSSKDFSSLRPPKKNRRTMSLADLIVDNKHVLRPLVVDGEGALGANKEGALLARGGPEVESAVVTKRLAGRTSLRRLNRVVSG